MKLALGSIAFQMKYETDVTNWVERMGFVLSGMNFGLLVSPFLGGIIYEKLGYYAVFYTSFSVIAFAFLLRLVTIEQSTAAVWLEEEGLEETPEREYGDHENIHDGSDQSTLTRSNGGRQHVSEPTENTALLHGNLKKPLSRFARNYSTMATLLRSPRLKAAVYGSFTLFVLTTAFDGILPLFVIRTYNWNASGAGLIFLALTCPSVFGVVFGALSDRFGPKKVSLWGFGITTMSLSLLSLTTNSSIVSKVLLCNFLAFVGLLPSFSRGSEAQELMFPTGIGCNLILAALAADLFFEVETLVEENPHTFDKKMAFAQAYSLFDSAIGLATAVGPVWAGFIYQQTNWQISVFSLAFICALGSVGVFRYTGGTSSKSPKPENLSNEA